MSSMEGICMKEYKDLIKKHLSIQETYIVASNLNRIDDAKKAQRVHTDLDSVFGILGGIAVMPLGVLAIIELIKCTSNIFEIIIGILFIFACFLIDIWYIRMNWKLLTGKF